MKRKIYDGFLFFNELDLLDIRLNTLNNVVDYFILVESSVTHAGDAKPFIFEENKGKFTNFLDKIIHIKVTDTPDDFSTTPQFFQDNSDGEFLKNVWSYINTTKNFDRFTQQNFGRDFFQKECIKRGMINASPSDILIASDLDEIPNPEIIDRLDEFFEEGELYTFNQTMYCYYFNLLRSSHINNSPNNREITHIWKGSRIGDWATLKNCSLNEVRSQNNHDIMDGGWHFSYMGGLDRVKQKIKASSAQEWNTATVINNLEQNLKEEKDVIYRGDYLTRVDIDDTYPQYFLDNLHKFKHFIKE
jgi:beta-1,4-mannosyl-glycoprotein beta-1,4-N-acetylglucosaminyltransferase